MNNLKASLQKLENFVREEKKQAGGDHVDFNGRDAAFLEKAKKLIEFEDKSSLRDLLEEMRGLSQYFCSYSGRPKELDRLVSELYNDVQSAI